MPVVLLRQVRRVLKVPRLPADADRRLQIKRQLVRVLRIPTRLGLDEAIQARDVFELGVRVEQQCGMVRVRKAQSVDFLKVGNEVVNALRVKEL